MASALGAGPAQRPVAVQGQRFSVGGETRTLYAGAVHYWRLDREKWAEIIDEVVELGFSAVSVFVPWEVHEVARGEFDFSGNKDLDAFLDLLEQRGLDIVVRPGPQISSELTSFGYPRRVLVDRRLYALNSRGTPAVLTQVPRPIPALSYASDEFYDEVALWYDAVCPVLARHAYPHGRVVAAQVDNEMAYFFHVNAYAADYHPASIARYRSFLVHKYGDRASLERAYGRSLGSFADIEPPRRFEARCRQDVPYYRDWAEYREVYLVDSMDRLARMMRSRGLDRIALFHNYPHPLGPGGAESGFTAPFNLAELEKRLDFVGFDVYSRKEQYRHVKTVLSYVVGTSRFPYIPELISGVSPWYLHPGDVADEEFVTKAALMQGIKGFSRYMLAERDRWLGSPIRRDGRVRQDRAVMFARANALLRAAGFEDLRRRADVVLMANREYDRLEAASVLVSFPGDFLETPSGFSEYPTFMTVSEEDLGFAQPVQMAKAEWFADAFEALSGSGYAFLLSDTSLPAQRWRDFKVVVVSAFEFMSNGLQEALVEYAWSGGTVLLGPRLPQLDQDMRPSQVLSASLVGEGAEVPGGREYDVGAGSVVVFGSATDLRAAIPLALSSRSLLRSRSNDERLDVAIHQAEPDSERVVVFVANPTRYTIEAEVSLRPEAAFVRELWDGADMGLSPVLHRRMSPYSINIYECRFQY